MARYAIVEQDADSVVVGARGEPPPRETDAVREEPAGPSCDHRTALYGHDHPADREVLDDLVFHDPGDRDDVVDLLYATRARILGEESRDP